MSRVPVPKYLARAQKLSERAGWRWVMKGSGHVHVFAPDGAFVTGVTNSGRERSTRTKALSCLRKAGCPGA